MAKIVYRQMPAPRELSQQMPASRAKARMQKPQGGANVCCQSQGCVGGGGGMIMDEIDTCIAKGIYQSYDGPCCPLETSVHLFHMLSIYPN